MDKKFNEWTFNNRFVNLFGYNDLETPWGCMIEGELYLCTSLKDNYATTLGWGTKSGKVVSDKFNAEQTKTAVKLLSQTWQKYKSTLNEEVITESNSKRREFTKKKVEEYLLSRKVKPVKKLIIDNEATKALCKRWDKDDFLEKGDSTGKLLLDPVIYGGHEAYAVWESVKGISDCYADIKTIDGQKWSFTELWISHKGVKKLQRGIVPLPNDFVEGTTAYLSGYAESRRRKALKARNNDKEGVEKDSKRLSEINKKMLSDDFNWNNDYEKYSKEEDALIAKHKDINYRNHRQKSKEQERDYQIMKNFMNISDRLDKYLSGKDNDEAWELNRKVYQIKKDLEDGKTSHKEIGNRITAVKKEIDDFIKNKKVLKY